ncbi:Ecp20-2 [Fulvia fulva]|uniref:Ecp20-2 n=1 Tax=Passalora fulva TaxID=5499 RepID=A0A1P8YXK1_PASFU|nr:Ecp20-2 [Fulvia fulva]AQA29228.1 extracellular protein 20-2 [Fulvia fulva]KAK4632303.1 Ecp20-2 [Fulvia fulva]KAK4633642.1 Ecp20-2 [Fulvia fulva]UJO14106.1 Ecp20-2 [Fulvia fulva]UOF86887.1 Ecp20 [Fulvia fulva]
MLFTNYLILAGAALAAAVPSELAGPKPNQFTITNFVFGCTVGCDWSFNVAVQGSGPDHPPVKKPVKCSGNVNDAKDYVDCGKISDTQRIKAYIVKATNQLKLEYEVQKPNHGAVYRYTGEKKVYAATGEHAKLQKPNFVVKETGSTGVA